MKKTFIISLVFVMFIMFATTTFAATSSLAEAIYSKGSAYGVTTNHKKQMEEYFTNNPVTAEQESYILAKADECIAIMDKAGVKDVTKLSESDLNAVKTKVQEAAIKIGLTVTYEGNYVKIWKNGRVVAELLVKSSSNGSATATANKFVYTGSNSTLGIASTAIVLVALAGVVKLRKNA